MNQFFTDDFGLRRLKNGSALSTLPASTSAAPLISRLVRFAFATT